MPLEKLQVPRHSNCHMMLLQRQREATGPGTRTLGLFVGQHSFCPLHMSLQQLRAPNLTGLLGRGHCGHFGLRTGGGAAGHTGEILSRARRAGAEPTLSGCHHLSACPLEFPGQEFTL